MLKCVFALLLLLPIAFGQVSLTTAQIAKRVSPSVVVIQGKAESGDVLGSGFIISKDGKIITNLHVIRDMKTASIQLANGEIFDSVSVLATDKRRDLAIVQIPGFNLPVLELGDSDVLTVGEPLVIVGSPLGLEATVTAGILSSVRDTGDGFKVLQTDAAVNPGNSGGPLLNGKGQAIGVVSFKLRSSEGLTFAIPINYLRGLLNTLHEPITLEQMRRTLSTDETGTTHEDGGGASLKETLEWLRDKIPLGVHKWYFSCGIAPCSYTSQNKVWTLDSCSASIGTESTSINPGYPDTYGFFRYTLSLGIINGGSIVVTDRAAINSQFVGGDRWEYDVRLTTSSREVLHQYSMFGGTPQSQTVNYVDLQFADNSMANRVLTALMHAAELCRNKEPF